MTALVMDGKALAKARPGANLLGDGHLSMVGQALRSRHRGGRGRKLTVQARPHVIAVVVRVGDVRTDDERHQHNH